MVIPPFKLYEAGAVNEDALRIILNQVRVPDWNRADLNGLVAACRTASRRVQEMCARFGTATYLSALDALLQRNYDAMKILLHLVFEEGRTLSFTDYICDDGVGFGPYELKLSLTRTGDKVHLDFTGSSPQAQGPINYYINENLVRMFFGIYMITVADPQILWNDGFYPLVDVTIPDGSFWKPKHPGRAERPQPRHRPGLRPLRRAARADQPGAAERGRVLLVAALHVLRQLLRRRPQGRMVPAVLHRLRRHSRAGRSATGRTGTRCGRASSTSPANSWSRTTRCGSRSGRPSPTPAVPGCTAAATGSTSPTGSWSRARSPSTTTAGSPTRGGSTAASRAPAARKWIDRADGSHEVLPSKCHDVPVKPGDVLHFVTWGGGGWGDALERDPTLVALEVRRGLVSAEGARRYGVVVDDDGALDAAATDALRAEIWPRPGRRAAGVRHGPGACRNCWSGARRRPGCRRRRPRSGHDAPARPSPRSAAGSAGAAAGVDAGRPDAGVLHRAAARWTSARRPSWTPAPDCWQRPAGTAIPVIHTAVHYRAGAPDGGPVRPEGRRAAAARRRRTRESAGVDAGRRAAGRRDGDRQAVRVGVLRHLAGRHAAPRCGRGHRRSSPG